MVGLAFVTNNEHVHLIYMSNGDPAHFFFYNSHPSTIKTLTFDSEAPRQSSALVLPVPASPNPALRSGREIHWSQASVENVIAVTSCCYSVDGFTRYTGLLLHYSNGNRACLGELRFDDVCSRLNVNDSGNIYLGFEMCKRRLTYLGYRYPQSIPKRTLLSGSKCCGALPSNGGIQENLPRFGKMGAAAYL
ncbi:unnamed protein product [Fusarium graminearum]|uniref:Uncharacterized protein n=1 Tax=Gibberella zeae TaxID=5518 RepID=A0A9N8NEH6_GIBZA|nr:unnamed protein product [Fusarium graminearum]CAG1971555.1 unnamed protein product [Fusarium graminearum]